MTSASAAPGESRPPLRKTSVTFRRAPKANVEIVARLRCIWDDTAGTDDTDDVEDLGDAEEHTLEPAEAARWYTGS
jgi:hypothetical protein